MNISSGDDLCVTGFRSELRDDAISIAMSLASMSMASSNHSLLQTTVKSERSGSLPQALSSKSPVAAQDGPIEVDFYRNPTMLSRMILYNKFANAQKRCRDHPWETCVWVCAKRKSNVVQPSSVYGLFDPSKSRDNIHTPHGALQEEYSIRQLPIHIACTSLAFAHDTTSRADLEQLIVRLVVTYPEGCAEFDHGGKLPLHEAIWSNASPETIAMLLMASPHSIDQRDRFGRTPIELNNRRTGRSKDEIRDMLNLGAQYWEHARQEAKLRMKLAAPTGGGKSIDSQSVLGASDIDKESIYTSASLVLPPRPKPHLLQIESEEILPIAWEQLERRVLLLEQLLAEMYEQNYELAGLVEELKQAKKTLRMELEAARTHTMQYNSKDKDRGKSRRSSTLSSCPSVAVVPEDDEMSSVKLMEQADRIEQLESLVDSYHSKRRKRRNTVGSRISDISSISSPTGTEDSSFIRRRTGLGREDSLVSGLTFSEESYFYETSLPSREARRKEEDNYGDFPTSAEDKPADKFGKWTPPVATTSFLPGRNRTIPMEVDDDGDGPSAWRKLSPACSSASEIYFPGARPARATAAAGLSSTMSENSTIVSVDNEVSFATGLSRSLESLEESDESDAEDDEELISVATKSTRARLEDMVFGSALVTNDDEQDKDDESFRPQRYNYDIKIPALDIVHTPSDETGEI